jgi:hypothetical protein
MIFELASRGAAFNPKPLFQSLEGPAAALLGTIAEELVNSIETGNDHIFRSNAVQSIERAVVSLTADLIVPRAHVSVRPEIESLRPTVVQAIKFIEDNQGEGISVGSVGNQQNTSGSIDLAHQLDRMANLRPGSAVESIDPVERAKEHHYSDKDVFHEAEVYESRRQTTVEYLRELNEDDWSKTFVLSGVPIAISEYASLILSNDLFHMDQMSLHVATEAATIS